MPTFFFTQNAHTADMSFYNSTSQTVDVSQLFTCFLDATTASKTEAEPLLQGTGYHEDRRQVAQD